MAFLKSVYSIYRARSRTKFMLVEHWFNIFEAEHLLDVLGASLHHLWFYLAPASCHGCLRCWWFEVLWLLPSTVRRKFHLQRSEFI